MLVVYNRSFLLVFTFSLFLLRGLKTSTTARDADLRTDLPKYRIYRDGVLMEEVSDVTDIVGNREMVGFLIGCSFSFEEALMMEGIEIRNVTENKNVSMYDTSIECIPALPIQTNMVVSVCFIRIFFFFLNVIVVFFRATHTQKERKKKKEKHNEKSRSRGSSLLFLWSNMNPPITMIKIVVSFFFRF